MVPKARSLSNDKGGSSPRGLTRQKDTWSKRLVAFQMVKGDRAPKAQGLIWRMDMWSQRLIAFQMAKGIKPSRPMAFLNEGRLVPRRIASHMQKSCSRRKKCLDLLKSFKQYMNACSFLSTLFFARCITLIAIEKYI